MNIFSTLHVISLNDNLHASTFSITNLRESISRITCVQRVSTRYIYIYLAPECLHDDPMTFSSKLFYQ